MNSDQTKYRFLLDLLVRNEWRNIALLRSSVKSCFQAVFADSGDRDTLAMVTSELLENAIKYGAWGEHDPKLVRLHVCGDDGTTEVTVESPVSTDGDSVSSLMSTLEWLRSFADPEQAYLARLHEIAAGGEIAAGSRLGLVRIAYEGNCRLSAALDQSKSMLAVTATLAR